MSDEKNQQGQPQSFRTFLIVWVSQSISVFGSALTFFAITIWLSQVLYPLPEQKSELAYALSALGLTFALPVVFIAPFAGVWADRYDRRKIMIIANTLNGLIGLTIAGLMIAGSLSLWGVLLLMAASAAVGAFHQESFDSSYAMIVPEKMLPRANGMMQTMWNLSNILSPGIAAAIISLPLLAQQGRIGGGVGTWLASLTNGTPLAVTIDAITFLGAAITLLFIHIPSPKRSGPRKSIWADAKEGALFIFRRQALLWLLSVFVVANFVGTTRPIFQTLMLRMDLAADWQARGLTFETALAMLNMVAGIGGVLGGFFISSWGGLKQKRILGVLVPMLLFALAQVGFGLSPWVYLTAAMGFVATFMMPVMNAHSQTIWQTQTPKEMQGRVFSVRRLIAQFTWPLSTALAGWFGSLFNPSTVVAVLGAVLGAVVLIQFINPALLQVESPQPESIQPKTTAS